MPRDGSHIYTLPFPDVVEGTTVESAVYNGFTNDVAQDLNAPRPISAGGTGADNAADAMSNLGGEGSKIEVTNYDSHNFTAGSFYSKASATAPPVAGHAFAGWCYPAVVAGVATTDLFIEARDRDDLTQPGSLYARQRKAGIWSGWLKAAGVNANAVPPDPATDNSLWWDPTQGKLFIRYNDGDTVQWVETTAVPDLGPDDFVSVDIDQVFTEAQKKTARSNIYAAPFDALAYNGMQINGSMEVSQENGTVSLPLANNSVKYGLDGWGAVLVGAGATASINQSPIGSLPGFTHCITFACSAVNALAAAADGQWLYQYIEGNRLTRLGWGTAKAQPITIGFWVYPGMNGNMAVSVRSGTGAGAGTRCYVVDVPIVTGAWSYKTVTIPGDTGGSWPKDNTAGATISFNFGAGSGRKAAANTWLTADTIATAATTNFFSAIAAAGTVYLTGVTILPGLEAPSAERSPLIMRPYGQELMTCQRYLFKYAPAIGMPIGAIQAYSATLAGGTSIPLPVPMRANPTVTISAAAHFAATNSGGGNIALSILAAAGFANAIYIGTSTFAGGLVAGNASVFSIAPAGWILADARL